MVHAIDSLESFYCKYLELKVSISGQAPVPSSVAVQTPAALVRTKWYQLPSSIRINVDPISIGRSAAGGGDNSQGMGDL